MIRLFEIIAAFLFCLPFIQCWDTTFYYNPCYNKRMDERMPNSMDNLIAVLEKYERDNPNTDAEQLANMILHRYRKNGVVFNQDSQVQWSVYQDNEISKQDLDDKLLKATETFPEDSFTPREECSLHMMVSHSTDVYPHEGVDYVWDNNDNYRKKRSISIAERAAYLPDDLDPADHPVEFGVIQTAAGPVAGGLLLAGIMTISSSNSYTVQDLLGRDNVDEYMPSEMKTKSIQPMYGATVSGKLAEASLLSLVNAKLSDFEIGPIGLFGNCTACARIYSLENLDYSYISRAEVFGALDGLIINRFMKQTSRTLKLSEILRLYYSRHGLLNSFFRACNRKDIYNQFEKNFNDDIREQALNYMYAFQDYFPELQSLVAKSQDDFSEIEDSFGEYLDSVMSTFSNFISSYSYDDPSYYRCPSNSDEIPAETQLDLVVIFSPTGSQDDIVKQAEYIALTTRQIGVGYHRSRMALLNGRNERWVTPMTNYSNIADYACNYTTYMNYASNSGQDFLKIMERLTEFYGLFYQYIRSDPDQTGKRSQVVLWNLPSSFDGIEDEMIRSWQTFNLTYPDVSFVFAGTKDTLLTPFFNDDNDNTDDVTFVETSQDSPEIISYEITKVFEKSPRMFVYAPCDTLNPEYENYNEGSHVYTNFVSPNFTTYIRIPPQNFHYSEFVKLSFKGNDVHVCLSREHKEPSIDDATEETYCSDSPFEHTQYYLCGRHLEQCDPIYISVAGSSAATPDCTDEECQTPGQIEFEFTHEGMICAASSFTPLFFILLAPVIVNFLNSMFI